MSCNHPFKAYFTGSYSETGKKQLIIDYESNSELLPESAVLSKGFHIGKDASTKVVNGKLFLCDPIPIPCGSCIGCRIDKAKEWSYRCLAESIYCKYTYFITLTYDDRHLPRWKDGSVYLSKKDVQKFFKRFRKLGYEFRYFLSGEYGSLSNRPHYHFLMFTDNELKLTQIGLNAFTCSDIEKTWPFGLVSVSLADFGCIKYTAGYIMKKIKADVSDFFVQPFLLMSRKPGIGSRYFYDHEESIKKTCKLYLKGETCPVPSLFWKYLEEDPELDSIKDNIKCLAENNLDKLKYFYNTKWTSEVGFKLDKAKKDSIKRREKI